MSKDDLYLIALFVGACVGLGTLMGTAYALLTI